MQRALILVGDFLAGLLDLCMGALIASATLSTLGYEVLPWHLALGAVLAVLPDFDIILPILTDQKGIENHHTTIMHRPLFLIPLAALVAYALGGAAWALLASLCVAWHFVHDTPPLSPSGIAWVWPLSEKFLSIYGARDPRVGTMLHDEWVQTYWLRPTVRSVSEIGAGLVALVLAVAIAIA